jgi:geranylgeranyl pyrophosphate synthase
LDLKQETQYLYKETKALLHTNVLDEKDKAAIIKTATSQMEKIINLMERSEAIAHIREFEAKVLRALKKVLPEQSEDFIKELEQLKGEDND